MGLRVRCYILRSHKEGAYREEFYKERSYKEVITCRETIAMCYRERSFKEG